LKREIVNLEDATDRLEQANTDRGKPIKTLAVAIAEGSRLVCPNYDSGKWNGENWQKEALHTI
jgi:hypothetical protein